MPFLWRHDKKLLTSKQSPSPKHEKMSRFCDSIERASMLASRGKKLAAGMTVEASLVLPLFLFFFLNLGSAIEMIRLHENLQMALWDVGNRICVYGYAADNAPYIQNKVSKQTTEKSWWSELADVALSYTYIKQEVTSYTGKEYLESSPLSYGCSGLQFWESDLFGTENDVIDIIMTYRVSARLNVPAVRPFWMANRYYGHLWTGYDVLQKKTNQKEEQDVVYITDHASVYHESRDCTHLRLTIREVTLEEALACRNEEGGKYVECSKCGKRPNQGTVFIGREGNAYHYDKECSGLKRTVHTITREEAAAYRLCSRCGNTR